MYTTCIQCTVSVHILTVHWAAEKLQQLLYFGGAPTSSRKSSAQTRQVISAESGKVT